MKAKYLGHNTITKALGVVALVFLFACSGNQSNSNKLTDDLNQQKEEMIEGLERLETNIDDTIDGIEDKLNLNEGPVEQNLEKVQENLKKKKEDVQASLMKAKNATNDNWENIKRDVNETTQDIEVEFNNLKAKIAKIVDGSDK